MYLTVHAAAGVLIGSYINSSPISFLVGFISHFFLDMLPHRDGNFPRHGHSAKSLSKLYFNKIVSLIYFDVCLAIVVAGMLFTNNYYFLDQSIIWGMIGAILPDVFQALSFFWKKNRFFKKFNEFHNFLHYTPEKQISFVVGNLTQIITLFILINPLIDFRILDSGAINQASE